MNQLKAGAALNYAIILLNTIVGLLYTPYMLRMMGKSEYGLYSLVASVISYLTILDLGLGNAVVRYTAKFRAEGKQREQYEMFGMFFVLYVIIGAVALLLGSALYFNVDAMFGATMTVEELYKARIMILLLVFNLAFTFPMSIFGSIITAYEHFVFPRAVSIIRILLNTGVMICLLYMGYRAVAMVVVQTVFNVATLLLNYIYCKRYLKIRIFFRRFRWGFLQEVAIYSFWIFLNVIMDKVYWSTGQFVLGAVVGTAAVAVFAVAIQLQVMYMQFSTAISQLFLPKITGMVATNDDNRSISDLFIRTGRIQYIVMALVLSGFIVFGRQFIVLWAGVGYEDAYIICLLFFFSLLIPMIQNLGITILQARNQMKFRSLLYIFIAMTALALQIVLARRYGGVGCAIAVSGALLLGQGLIMNIYYSKRQGIDIGRFWKEIFRMSVIPIAVTTTFLFADRMTEIDSWRELAVGIVLFCVIYIPLFWVFSMNKYERELLMIPMRRILLRHDNQR
ncbi:oligosaccharide flippase family protein [Alistipes dispar]|uniref:Polysaccharide biosynthesis protein n=1 Tax=Alistipes dispar TaxID=2585119 RepID=A0A4Y1WY09_9BACT|nr:oligosaccharide flippase family protein [Alistipes dispar]BBL05861.1 polysaccharide biosynthesis protein [Alistipes dispar]